MKKYCFLLAILILLISGCSIPGISKKNDVVADQKAPTQVVCDLKNDAQDCDNDGLSNAREKALGTNPENADSDEDSYSDGNEVKNGYDPLMAVNDVKKQDLYNPVAVALSSTEKKINFVYETKIGNKFHVIFNGADLGTISTSSNQYKIVKGNDIAFLRDFPTGKLNEKGRAIIERHIIFNGKDVGIGEYSTVKISNGNIIFFTNSAFQGRVIVNGKDLGETFMNDGAGEGDPLFENKGYIDKKGNYAYYKNVNGEINVIYNGKDMGPGWFNDVPISDGNVVFANKSLEKDKNGFSLRHIIYNGKDLGVGDYPVIEGNNLAYITYESESTKDLMNQNSVIFNGKNLGSGKAETIQLFGNNIVFMRSTKDGTKIVINGNVIGDFDPYGRWPEIFENHIVYERKIDNKLHVFMDGKDLGEGKYFTFAYSNDNYAFERNSSGATRIIYNGKDIGEGENPVLSGNNFAFLRKSDMHVIYNGKDLGEGKWPILKDDNIAYIKGTDYYGTHFADHIILNGKDIGSGFRTVFSKAN